MKNKQFKKVIKKIIKNECKRHFKENILPETIMSQNKINSLLDVLTEREENRLTIKVKRILSKILDFLCRYKWWIKIILIVGVLTGFWSGDLLLLF